VGIVLHCSLFGNWAAFFAVWACDGAVALLATIADQARFSEDGLDLQVV
jgi:hypothetical protein